jgi:hypothetical protein
MLRRGVVTGLAALGLIGGAGAVHWHGNTATVSVKDKNGVTHTASITGDSGRRYSCPAGERDKLNKYIEAAGRIKITQQLHPARYNELVPAYNAEIDAYNAAIEADCTAN